MGRFMHRAFRVYGSEDFFWVFLVPALRLSVLRVQGGTSVVPSFRNPSKLHSQPKNRLRRQGCRLLPRLLHSHGPSFCMETLGQYPPLPGFLMRCRDTFFFTCFRCSGTLGSFFLGGVSYEAG